VVVVVVDVVVDVGVLGDVVGNVVVLGGVVDGSATRVVVAAGTDPVTPDDVALSTVRLVQPTVTRTSTATKLLVRPDMTRPDGTGRRRPQPGRRASAQLVGPRQDG
jgi:hypothetical protein